MKQEGQGYDRWLGLSIINKIKNNNNNNKIIIINKYKEIIFEFN